MSTVPTIDPPLEIEMETECLDDALEELRAATRAARMVDSAVLKNEAERDVRVLRDL